MKAQDITVGGTYAVAWSIRKDRPTKWIRVTIIGEAPNDTWVSNSGRFFVKFDDGTVRDICTRDIRKIWDDREMSA